MYVSSHGTEQSKLEFFAPPRAAHSNPPMRMNLAWHFLRLKLGTTNFGTAFVGRAVHANLNRFACLLACSSFK
jgi:hypothetical protein